MLVLIIAGIIAAFLVALSLSVYLFKKESGTPKMKEISSYIQHGARTFLDRQYMALTIFVVFFSFLLYFFFHSFALVFTFILGSVFSALAGNLGMNIATRSNTKVAWACKKNENQGLKIAFFSGSVMSFLVVGLSILGIFISFLLFKDPNILFGFGFGASSIALFARVAGGIYTKSADIGADLVGKIEKKLPEDDIRNPAVIADQVGDNVGDVAGAGADLFESYSDIVLAAIVLGSIIGISSSNSPIILPLTLASIGIFSSILALFFIKGKHALFTSIIFSSFFMLIFSFFIMNYFFQDINLFYCLTSGLVAGLVIGFTAFYYTSYKFKPTQNIAREAKRGAALNIISGLGEGMLSTVGPVIVIAAAILISYHFSSLYGIAIAGIGMLSTLATTLATDCFGSVSDNAKGISQMSGLGKQAKERTSKLDAMGNTTAALGKGFAIGSAALTALVLFVIYTVKVGLESISITDPKVIVGLLLGALIPFLFSSLTLKAVSTTARKVVDETRKQFKERVSKGKKPLYERCIVIVTDSSLKNMILPALLAIAVPLIIGFVLGKAALGGFLASSICTGFLLAITMANSGGAFDNAKKYIEDILKKKKTPQHEASIIGDTVGDPLKDCSGPSLNILLKLMAIVALIFFPLF